MVSAAGILPIQARTASNKARVAASTRSRGMCTPRLVSGAALCEAQSAHRVGGWWAQPKAWRRNTVVWAGMTSVIAAITIMYAEANTTVIKGVREDAKLWVRLRTGVC